MISKESSSWFPLTWHQAPLACRVSSHLHQFVMLTVEVDTGLGMFWSWWRITEYTNILNHTYQYRPGNIGAARMGLLAGSCRGSFSYSGSLLLCTVIYFWSYRASVHVWLPWAKNDSWITELGVTTKDMWTSIGLSSWGALSPFVCSVALTSLILFLGPPQLNWGTYLGRCKTVHQCALSPCHAVWRMRGELTIKRKKECALSCISISAPCRASVHLVLRAARIWLRGAQHGLSPLNKIEGTNKYYINLSPWGSFGQS